MNASESFVKLVYESRGFKSLRNSAPDFIFFKTYHGRIDKKSILFVEVKTGRQQMTKDQKTYSNILKLLGAKVVVKHVDQKIIDGRSDDDLMRGVMFILQFGHTDEYTISHLNRVTGISGKRLQEVLQSLQMLHLVKSRVEEGLTLYRMSEDANKPTQVRGRSP
jgi:hypothetical protein